MNSISRNGTSRCLCKNFHSELLLSLMHVCAQSLSWVQLYVTSWTGTSVHGISQTRSLGRGAIPFSNLSPGLPVKCVGIMSICPEEGGTGE